jgi:hypothetical protein
MAEPHNQNLNVLDQQSIDFMLERGAARQVKPWGASYVIMPAENKWGIRLVEADGVSILLFNGQPASSTYPSVPKFPRGKHESAYSLYRKLATGTIMVWNLHLAEELLEAKSL